jgi:hypothetical protein
MNPIKFINITNPKKIAINIQTCMRRISHLRKIDFLSKNPWRWMRNKRNYWKWKKQQQKWKRLSRSISIISQMFCVSDFKCPRLLKVKLQGTRFKSKSTVDNNFHWLNSTLFLSHACDEILRQLGCPQAKINHKIYEARKM